MMGNRERWQRSAGPTHQNADSQTSASHATQDNAFFAHSLPAPSSSISLLPLPLYLQVPAQTPPVFTIPIEISLQPFDSSEIRLCRTRPFYLQQRFERTTSVEQSGITSTDVDMKVFTLAVLAFCAAVSVALPWDSPYEKGCCISWHPLLKKCYRCEDGCDREKYGQYWVSVLVSSTEALGWTDEMRRGGLPGFQRRTTGSDGFALREGDCDLKGLFETLHFWSIGRSKYQRRGSLFCGRLASVVQPLWNT